MQKPDKFLIHWKSNVPQNHSLFMEGAIWSAGNKFFYYQKEFGAYFSFTKPENAFSLATGISRGIAYKIPSMFFPTYFKNNWLNSFKQPSIAGTRGITTKIIGVDITPKFIEKYELEVTKNEGFIKNYFRRSTQVVSNHSKADALKSRKHEIEKNSKKYDSFYTAMDDSKDPETIKSLLRDFDERIKNYAELPENKHVEHVKVNERYEDINTTPLNSEDFIFQIPAGVVFKGNELEQLIENTN